MKAFVITLESNQYSIQVADRCIESAKKHGLIVEKFYGTNKDLAEQVMADRGLEWTWATKNTVESVCPKTGLHQVPYRSADLRAIIGCAMSHYSLWEKCVTLGEPILILEHDSIFLKDFPNNVEFNGICQINDPAGATRNGVWWSKHMKSRGSIGVHSKTWVPGMARPNEKSDNKLIPNGLAGNSAYMIKPWAAKEVIDKVHEIGVWPNDATICIQLFPYLEEYYPFVTKAIQGKSTTTT